MTFRVESNEKEHGIGSLLLELEQIVCLDFFFFSILLSPPLSPVFGM